MFSNLNIKLRTISRSYVKNLIKKKEKKPLAWKVSKRWLHSVDESQLSSVSSFINFCGLWPQDEKSYFMKDMQIIPNFLTIHEEEQLLEEVDPYLKRLRYEFDHWDNAIHGFRETERKNWYPHNRKTIQKISDIAFNGEIMPYIHILDLDEKGVIKPHVDSTRYCGHTIAGVSLLSDAVMRLVRTDEKKYIQGKNVEISNDESYRNQPNSSIIDNFYADILLPRRSLYIMSHSARYNFTHEILANEKSEFEGKQVQKTRRVSIICRNDP